MDSTSIPGNLCDGLASICCYPKCGSIFQSLVRSSLAFKTFSLLIIRHSVQKIQLLPAKEASLRLIPNMLIGFILNPTIGLAVQHVRIDYLLTIASMLSAVAPLLLALTDPAWSYWYAEFWSMLLCGVAVDGM